MDVQIKRGLLEVCVLAAIKNRESYGYQIVKGISPYTQISESTLYPILRRLEASALLQVWTEEYNGRLRKYYYITPLGRNRIEEFREELGRWSGGEITLRVLRGDKTMQFAVTPSAGKNGGELGVWLRDGMAGLGTVSFYDPATGLYGALGHAVNDIDTGVLIPVRDGEIMAAEVSGVVRGECGKPGELLGSFDSDAELGSIETNCTSGIFGQLDRNCSIAGGCALEMAQRHEIMVGEATVLAGVDGTVREYAVEISRIYPGETGGRDLLITVTDPALIEKTGGIVQGMSGSPIIQDGKLVGAVTHVLVNDPTRGYGIFIENMLEAAE